MRYQNDEDVKNTSYINKDFPMLWQELIELVPKLTDKWNPAEANESDPLAVLLKLIALFNDKTNYNIDKSILEAFPSSLTQIRSAYNVYDILGYNPRWYRSALTPISFTLNNTIQGNTTDNYKIPALTPVSDVDNTITYTTLQDIIFNPSDVAGTTTKTTSAIQGTVNDYTINGSKVITLINLDADNKLYFTESNVAQNGVFISSEETFASFNLSKNVLLGDWTRVDNIYQVDADEKAFKFGIDPVSGACYIQFPDTIANLIGSGIYIKYTLSAGEAGNIKSNTLTKFAQETQLFTVETSSSESVDESINASDYLLINNLEATSNGYNPETINEMYKSYQRVKNVFNTLVTLRDYENYIYNYSTPEGSAVVSNIKASDRNNDLYDSYKVITLDLNRGEVEKSYVEFNTTTQAPDMNAYNIRFFPLKAPSSILTDNSFKESFKSYESVVEANQWQSLLQNVIEEAKTLNHDQLIPGRLIPVDYDLIGDIYLTERVTAHVANQIMDNVKMALRKKLNAHELTLGEPVSYKDVLDAIKTADSRIDYVALQPIQYISEINIPAEITNTPQITAETIIKRNVLAGALPWTDYDTDFSFTANQSAVEVIPLVAGTEVSSKIQVGNFTTATNHHNIFTLKTNENLSLFAPAYQEDTIYTNFLYFRYDNCPDAGITKDVMHTLGSGETIYFYETRDAYNEAQSQHALNAIYTLGPGTIVKFNFNFSATSTINSLNQGKTIAKMKRSAGDLADATSDILFFTNATNLLNQFRAPDSNSTEGFSYTLKISEYFLFKLTNSTSFTLFGEGTTITFGSNYPTWLNDNVESTYLTNLSNLSIDWEGIQDGTVSSANSFNNLWLPQTNYMNTSTLKGNQVQYQVNQILNFGEGCGFGYFDSTPTSISESCSIAFNDSSVKWFTQDTDDHNYYSDASTLFTVQPLQGADPDISSLKLYYTQSLSDPQWIPLEDLPGSTDKWQGLLTLNVNGSKENPQVLCVTENPNELSHTQLVYADSVALPHTEDLYIELNPALESAGIDLTLPVDIQLYSYELNPDVAESISSAYFVEIKTDETSHTATWTNPVTGKAAVVPFYLSTETESPTFTLSYDSTQVASVPTNSVLFMVMESNKSLSLLSVDDDVTLLIGKNIGVASPTSLFGSHKYIANSGVTPYTLSDLYGSLLNSINDDLTDQSDILFNYTHIPEAPDLIDINQPLSGEAALNGNNVINVFTIPRLNSLILNGGKWIINPSPTATLFSNLKVNKLSIR